MTKGHNMHRPWRAPAAPKSKSKPPRRVLNLGGLPVAAECHLIEARLGGRRPDGIAPTGRPGTGR